MLPPRCNPPRIGRFESIQNDALHGYAPRVRRVRGVRGLLVSFFAAVAVRALITLACSREKPSRCRDVIDIQRQKIIRPASYWIQLKAIIPDRCRPTVISNQPVNIDFY